VKLSFALFALAFGASFVMTAESSYALDTEYEAEWIYMALSADYDCLQLVELIESTLDAVLSGIPAIADWEVDESVENGLIFLKEDYANGELSKEEYEREYAEITDREQVKRELMDAAAGGDLRDGYAAIELLVVLLGKPGLVFEHMLDAYGSEVGKEFRGRFAKCDRKRLVQAVPRALNVVSKLREKESARRLGWIDRRAVRTGLDTLNRLENDLVDSNEIN
jgi:hypothetical protein